jgi:cell division protein FtsX
VYFAQTATMRQISRAIAAIRGEPGVMRVSFVSKEASFAVMKKRYPNLVKNLAHNPLPDSVTVRISPRADHRTIYRHLRARHLAGVDAIRY